MALTPEDVENIARLARLKLSEREKIEFARQLDQILEHFRHLQRLDTQAVPPTSHPLPLLNVFREDAVSPSLTREQVLANAPDRDEHYFIVPRIVE